MLEQKRVILENGGDLDLSNNSSNWNKLLTILSKKNQEDI